MQRINTVIIGGGQAGLAMSRCLSDWKIDHVVLERGRTAERWRSQRWDSLRLLTPNWMSRLPGWSYRGSDPDGYMTAREVVDYLAGFAASLPAPVEEQTTVLAVEAAGDGYRVATDRGSWRCDNLVIATGQCDRPRIPGFAAALPGWLHQLAPADYRRPGDLPDGGVLVVGASASGVQLADELHRSGRPVTLAVGRHTRLPRRYRGRDIMWWLEMIGTLGESADNAYDLDRARRQPSLQLAGRPDHADLDLAVLRRRGVTLVGRTTGADGGTVGVAGDLADTTAAADHKLDRLLDRIDRFVARYDLHRLVAEPDRPARFTADEGPVRIDLRATGIRSVVWATGYRRSYPWLGLPIVDRDGELRHRGGVTPAPGVYVLGLPFLRRRKSNFIDGVGDDARFLAARIAARTFDQTAVAA
jgi:putative flavoprotein involved in K+ transport